ncbi:MAG: hypothetical protein K2N34_02745, partial [Lachnospiraceae bacterium]|nr:hypothetical protein [Lachnospiraceae bacterium]
KLVEEAKLKVTVIREEAKRGRQGVGKNLSSDTRQGERDRFAGMSVGEIRKQLDKEELLYGDSESGNNDSTIEIFEFDKEKEGRVKNIGDELTKTAEIDIDEIKIKLNNQDDIYNTANIQAALAKSMEKLLEFSEDKKYSEVRNAFMDLKEEYEPEIGEELDVGQEELEVVSKQTAKQQKEEEVYPELIEEIKPEEEIYPEPIEEIKPEEEIYPEPIEEIKPQEIYPEPIEEIKPQEVYPKPAEDIMRQEAVHTEAVSEKQPVLMEEIEPQKELYPEPAVKAPRLQEEMYAEPIEEVKEPQEPIAEIHRTYEESIDKEQAVSKESAEQDLDSYLDDYPSGATKRINREEINRLLHEQRSMFQAETSSLSGKDENDKVSQAEEQIEGQMTMDEVLAGFHNKISDEDKTSKLEALKAEEKELANIETEDDMEEIEESSEVSEENNMWKVETPEEGNQWKTEMPETAEEEKSSGVINLFEENEQIPEEYRDIFNDFVGTGSMEKDIAQTLDNLINNFAMDGTSRTNNVIVTGSAKIGKTTLGLGIIKAANKGRNRGGRRVAKVKASVLNKRGVALAMTQIIGTDLIIEQAGNLMPNTLVDLMIAMKNYTEEMLIVLEDDKAAIDRMLDNTPDMKEFFTNRLDIQEMEINDMVKIAKEYAAEQFYEIDEMGELALYAKLDDISGKNPVLSVEDIQEVIDEAIAHANRFGIGKLFGKIRKGKGDMGTLTEHDFL